MSNEQVNVADIKPYPTIIAGGLSPVIYSYHTLLPTRSSITGEYRGMWHHTWRKFCQQLSLSWFASFLLRTLPGTTCVQGRTRVDFDELWTSYFGADNKLCYSQLIILLAMVNAVTSSAVELTLQFDRVQILLQGISERELQSKGVGNLITNLCR